MTGLPSPPVFVNDASCMFTTAGARKFMPDAVAFDSPGTEVSAVLINRSASMSTHTNVYGPEWQAQCKRYPDPHPLVFSSPGTCSSPGSGSFFLPEQCYLPLWQHVNFTWDFVWRIDLCGRIYGRRSRLPFETLENGRKPKTLSGAGNVRRKTCRCTKWCWTY